MTAGEAGRAGTPQGVFGAEVRHYRTEAGLSQADLAARAHVSHDVISKIETGERPPAADFPARLDAVPDLATRGALARLWGHLRRAQRQQAYPGWFQRWPDAEAAAEALRSYEPLLVPGLLQTEDYARAILSAQADADEDAIEQQVAARLARQEILARADPPHLWCVLDEGVLHRPSGGRKTMHDQLGHLARMARRPRISVQVVPFSAGAHPGLRAHFVIAGRDGGPGIVYLETATAGQVAEAPAAVAQTGLIFDSLRAEALPRTASADLIVKVAEERWT